MFSGVEKSLGYSKDLWPVNIVSLLLLEHDNLEFQLFVLNKNVRDTQWPLIWWQIAIFGP